MSNSWFYIRQWRKKKIDSIGLEMDYKNAEILFRYISGYDDDVYIALLNKEDKWKVVASKEDISDWKVMKSSENNKGIKNVAN